MVKTGGGSGGEGGGRDFLEFYQARGKVMHVTVKVSRRETAFLLLSTSPIALITFQEFGSSSSLSLFH